MSTKYSGGDGKKRKPGRPKKVLTNDIKQALTAQQQEFVRFLITSETFDPKEAAEKAGYARPSKSAHDLLKNKAVRKALVRYQEDREERTEISADEIWDYLKHVLYMNPFRYFTFDESGYWVLKDPEDIPDEIGMFIENLEVVDYHGKDGSHEQKVKVSLVSKTTALGIAARHSLVEHREVDVKMVLDWEAMFEKSDDHTRQQKRMMFQGSDYGPDDADEEEDDTSAGSKDAEEAERMLDIIDVEFEKKPEEED